MQLIADVVEHIYDRHLEIPLAVVSGSPRSSVLATLAALRLSDRFACIVGAEDYQHGKPHPEPYLLAAQKLGIAARDCLVFEDTDLGVASAKAAGMSWVKVPTYSARRIQPLG